MKRFLLFTIFVIAMILSSFSVGNQNIKYESNCCKCKDSGDIRHQI